MSGWRQMHEFATLSRIYAAVMPDWFGDDQNMEL